MKALKIVSKLDISIVFNVDYQYSVLRWAGLSYCDLSITSLEEICRSVAQRGQKRRRSDRYLISKMDTSVPVATNVDEDQIMTDLTIQAGNNTNRLAAPFVSERLQVFQNVP